jgi:hypothetical protein
MPPLSQSQVTALHSKNQQNFSKVKPGEATFFRQGGQVVLVGDGHDPEVIKLVEKSPAFKLGQIKLVRAAKAKDKKDKGEVLVSGASGRAEFEKEFGLIMEGATIKYTQWQPAR